MMLRRIYIQLLSYPKLYMLQKSRILIEFQWFLGHCGLRGNAEADRIVRLVADLGPIPSRSLSLSTSLQQSSTNMMGRTMEERSSSVLNSKNPIILIIYKGIPIYSKNWICWYTGIPFPFWTCWLAKSKNRLSTYSPAVSWSRKMLKAKVKQKCILGNVLTDNTF